MINFDKDDTFLARWLAGELSEAERLALEHDPRYPALQKIADTAALLQAPEADMDAFRSKVFEFLPEKQAPVQTGRRIRMGWWLLAAAAFAGFLAFAVPNLWQRVPAEILVTTAAGEQKTISLPDGSSVRMNAGSELRFQEKGFAAIRQIAIAGEAFFKVQKNAKPFIVEAGSGKVEVLGTSFDVRSRQAGALEVQCYEGSVRVSASGAEQKTLLAGEGLRLQAGGIWAPLANTGSPSPAWLTGLSEFDKAPLSTVFEEIGIQYGVLVEHPEFGQTLHTGAFPHNNLAVALKTVCGAHRLQYRIDGKKVFVTR